MNLQSHAGPLRALPLLFVLSGCGGPGSPAARGPATDTIRVLSYNIHHGAGLDERLDLDRIAAVIRSVDPDLVALQEIDSVTSRTEGTDQAREIGRRTGMQSVFGRFMPYRGGAYGMALLSRWPLAGSTNHRLPDGAEPRTALAATVISPTTGRALRLVGVHLYRTSEERMAQAVALDSILRDDDVPTILAGDFNSTPDSDVMVRLGRAWHVVDKGTDRLTFPSDGPDREIDFVLLRPGSRFEVLSSRLLDEPIASDHRPVLVDLLYRE